MQKRDFKANDDKSDSHIRRTSAGQRTLAIDICLYNMSTILSSLVRTKYKSNYNNQGCIPKPSYEIYHARTFYILVF